MAASKNPEALMKPHFFHERKTIGHGESVIAGCLKAASKNPWQTQLVIIVKAEAQRVSTC